MLEGGLSRLLPPANPKAGILLTGLTAATFVLFSIKGSLACIIKKHKNLEKSTQNID